MKPVSIKLIRGPVALPQTALMNGTSKQGPYASASSPKIKAMIGLVSTGLTSSYLTAQRSVDDGATWVEVPGPALVKTGAASDITPNNPNINFIDSYPYKDKIFTFGIPVIGTMALYAFDVLAGTWSTVNATAYIYTPIVGIEIPSPILVGINSDGFGVLITNDQLNLLTFDANTGICSSAAPILLPAGPSIGGGVASDDTVFSAYSTPADQMLKWKTGDGPGDFVLSALTPVAVLDLSTKLFFNAVGFDPTTAPFAGVRYLNTQTGEYVLSNPAGNVWWQSGIPYFLLHVPSQSFLLVANATGIGGAGSTTLQVSYSIVFSSWNNVSPALFFDGATSLYGDNASASLESVRGNTYYYGLIVRTRDVLTPDLLEQAFYFLIAVTFSVPFLGSFVVPLSDSFPCEACPACEPFIQETKMVYLHPR